MGALVAAATARVSWEAAAVGVDRPRRARAEPDRCIASWRTASKISRTVYDERSTHRWGHWRPIIVAAVVKFLSRGILEHGSARVRCGDCAHEYLLAFSSARGGDQQERVEPPQQAP